MSRTLPLALLTVALSLRASAGEAPPLDLGAVLVEAESRNPEILAALARRSAAQTRPSQAAALPDPMATVAYTNDGLAGLTLGSSEFSGLTFGYSQEVPFPGKRSLAAKAARAEIDVAAETAEETRLRVLAEVKLAYAELFRLDRTAGIYAENRKLLESLLASARARYESGEGTLESVLRAQTELLKIDADVEGLRHERVASAQMLNSLLGRTLDEPLGPALVAPAVDPYRHASVARSAIERAPKVRRASAEVERLSAKADLAERNRRPDFVWSTEYVNRGGLDPMVTGGFGVRLPLFHRAKQDPAVAEARYELDAARRDVLSEEAASLAGARHWATQAERAEAMMRIYSDGVLPQARSAVDSAAGSYAAGKVPFSTVIEDFLALLRYETEFERLREDRIRALARLEPLVAARLVFPGLPEGPGTPVGESK